MRRPERLCAPLLCLLATGCAVSSLELAPASSNRPWVPATGSSGEIIPGPATGAPTARGYVLPPNRELAGMPASPGLIKGHAYTLPELIDVAQSHHPLTRIAWENARDAALAAGIARSAYLPHVAVNAIAGEQFSHGSSSTLGVAVPERHDVTGAISTLSLEWLLFDFGERDAVVDAAQQVSIGTNVAYTAAHQAVIFDVCMAYYLRMASHARVASAEQSLANAESVEGAARERQLHGVGSVVEVAQAQQATAQARLAQVEAQGAAKDAEVALLTAMGVSPLSEVEIAQGLERPLPAALVDDTDKMVAQALSSRPDVLAAFATQKASFAGIRAAQAEFKPKFFLSLTGNRSDGHLGVSAVPSIGQQSPTLNVSGNHWGSTILLGVTVPLYDGGLRAAQLQRAHDEADKAAATLEQVQYKAAREVVDAQNRLRTSLAAHDAAIALEEAAGTTFEAADQSYRGGVGTLTAATSAQTQWLAARDARTDTYYSVLSAAAGLAFALGSLGAVPEQH